MVASNRPNGYTLLELLMVVAIIGLLLAITVSLGLRAINRSRQAFSMQTMKDINTSIAIKLSLTGRYPATLPEVDSQKKDGWRRTYVYTSTGESFELRSLGRDGEVSPGISSQHRDDFDLDIVMKDGQFISKPVD